MVSKATVHVNLILVSQVTMVIIVTSLIRVVLVHHPSFATTRHAVSMRMAKMCKYHYSLLLRQLWASFVIKVEKERGLGPQQEITNEAQSSRVA